MYTASYACDSIGIILMLLLLFTNRGHFAKMKKTKYLFYMGLVTILSCFFDMLSYMLEGKPGLFITAVLHLSNSATYLNVIIMSYFWLRLEGWIIGVEIPRFAKYLSYGAGATGVLLLVVNLFYPLVYSLAGNCYERGPLYYLYLIIGGAILVYSLLIYADARSKGRQQLPFSGLTLLCPLLLGVLVQSMTYGVSALWPSVAVAVAGLASTVKNDLINMDSLTAVYNRHYLEQFMTRNKGRKGLALTGILVDLNDFKMLNDTLGRETGDVALAAAADIFSDAMKACGSVIRYGGDEFLLLADTADPLVTKSILDTVTQRMEQYNRENTAGITLSVSMGTAVYEGEMQTLEQFLDRLTALVSEEKAVYRRRNGSPEAVNVKLGAIPLSPDILAKANIGLWAFELDEGEPPRMYVDGPMLGLVGLTEQVPPEETYHAWYDHIDEGSYPLVSDAVEKMISGEHAEVQYPWHHPDGRTMIVRCGGVRNFNYTKGVRIEGTHQDVTETLHFDEQETHRQLERERFLANQQRQLKSFGDMVNAALWSIRIDGENRVVDVTWSDEFRRMLGYEPDEADFPNELESWSDSLYPEDRERAIQNLELSFKSRNYATFAYDIEYRLIRKNGECCWYHAVGRMAEEAGGIRELYGIFYDISADKELEEQRQQLAQALALAESASKAKTEFLFSMSHDIRTPMNAILGYTNIALNHEEERVRVHDALVKIRNSGDHLLDLINDILEMSRIEAGRLELVESPVSVYDAVGSVISMSRGLATEKEVSFSAVFGDIPDPYCYADELHINQVLINLISNAIKYTPAGGRVEFRTEQIDRPENGVTHYRFTVADNGIGMSEEFQEHLFESFARENTATVSRQEGAGLGLSIVKKTIDLVGGTISVQSRKGEGSTFVVEVPLRVMDSAAIEAYRREHSESDRTDGDRSFDGQRVLVVEDNVINLEISVEMLTDIGFTVETAEDGAVAVKLVEEKGAAYYDYILMDIQMPVMNGYEATAAIRRLPFGGDIPIIALSANAFREDRERSRAAGMNGHVAKPIDVKELTETMMALR